MSFKPFGDRSIGPLIVVAAIAGFLAAIALFVYIVTLK
jgi:hypothetical protein